MWSWNWVAGICLAFFLSGCGDDKLAPKKSGADDPNPQKTTVKPLSGSYRLNRVDCDASESMTYSSAFLSSILSVTVTYQGESATRRTTLGGCTQVVPMSPIIYEEGQMVVTELQSHCEEASPGDCTPFLSLCSTPQVTDTYKYSQSGSQLSIEIPPASIVQANPCTGQSGNSIIFNYLAQ